MRKVQEQNKYYKSNQEQLSIENLSLSNKFQKMKRLVMEYEFERVKQQSYAEESLNQLQAENESLRSLLHVGREQLEQVGQDLLKQEMLLVYDIPILVQQMMVERMDEVQQRGGQNHLYEEEDPQQQYLDVFGKQMGKTSNLKQMLISSDSLANELQELYGDEEMPQEEVDKMLTAMNAREVEECDDRDDLDREAVDE